MCSPIGEVFRSRLRQFPSLVNCCTIDWFSEWPDEALHSVAKNFMGEITEIEDAVVIDGLVKSCVAIHQTVAVKSQQFLAELSRYNYVTPTSYLELLGTFSKLLRIKINEVSTQRNRTKTGLDKVSGEGEEEGERKERKRGGRGRGRRRGRELIVMYKFSVIEYFRRSS